MTVELHEVNCQVRDSIPEEGITIEELINMELIKKYSEHILEACFYFRYPEDCPYNRGNWIFDIKFSNGNIACFKLPKEMTEEHVRKYLAPFFDVMNKEKAKFVH